VIQDVIIGNTETKAGQEDRPLLPRSGPLGAVGSASSLVQSEKAQITNSYALEYQCAKLDSKWATCTERRERRV